METYMGHYQDLVFIMWVMGVGAGRLHEGVLEAFIDGAPPKKDTPGSRNSHKIRNFSEALSVSWRKEGHGRRAKKAINCVFGDKDNTASKDKT